MQQPFVIPKSNKQDYRKYELHYLPNKTKILLVHDPHTYKSSCAISIGVGSCEDPENSLGLAHFMEHMIFMGSGKFSNPTEYTSFISLNSGYENAETNDSNTVFNFQIATSAFEEAIVRTCDFLVNPILLPDCIAKERQAIHEEFILAQNDDDNRRDEIIKKFAIKPYCKFNMGNNATLNNPNILNDLREFYQQYYSSDIMNVVLYSNQTIEEMKFKLFKYFEQIPNKNISENLKRTPQFFEKDCRQFIQIESLENESKLIFCWSLQNLSPQHRYQLFYYLQYFLGHQGDNSLNFALRQLDYAQNSQLKHQDCLQYSLLTLQVELTQHGENNINYVFTYIINYLQKHLKVSKQLFDEMKMIEDLKYKISEIEDMEDFICQIANNMIFMNPQDILSKVNYLCQFNEDILSQLICKFIQEPKKYLLIYSCPQQIKNPKVEPWYGTKYAIKPMPANKLPKKLPQISDISLNPLLPVVQHFHKSPNTIRNTPIILEAANIYFYNHNFEELQSLNGSVKILIHYDQSFTFCLLLQQFIAQLLESIEDCSSFQALGVQCSCYYLYGKLAIQITGIASLLVIMVRLFGRKLSQTVENIKNDDLDDLEDIFNDAKQALEGNLDNYYDEEIEDLAEKIKDQILIQNGLSVSDTIKQLEKIKKKKFLRKFPTVWEEAKLEWIYVGNFDPNVVQQISIDFQKMMNITSIRDKTQVKLRQIKVMKLFKDKNIKHELRLQQNDSRASTCLIYFEAGPFSNKLLMILQIIVNYLDEPFYSVLRTDKKLSYNLEMTVVNTKGILGVTFMLISSVVDPEKISRQIHKFLKQWADPQIMAQRIRNKFEKLKESVTIKYLEPFLTTEDLADFISEQIIFRTYCFNRKQKQFIADILDKITEKEIVQEGQKILNNGSLQIFLLAKNHKAQYNANRPKITDFRQIKNDAQYYEDNLHEFMIGMFR